MTVNEASHDSSASIIAPGAECVKLRGPARPAGNAGRGFADVTAPLVTSLGSLAARWPVLGLAVASPPRVTSRGRHWCHRQPHVHHCGRKRCPWADWDLSLSCNWYFLRFLTVIPLIRPYLFHPRITRPFAKEGEHLCSRLNSSWKGLSRGHTSLPGVMWQRSQFFKVLSSDAYLEFLMLHRLLLRISCVNLQYY